MIIYYHLLLFCLWIFPNKMSFKQTNINYKQDACESQEYYLNSLPIIKLYGLAVKTKYFQHAKLFVERVQIP